MVQLLYGTSYGIVHGTVYGAAYGTVYMVHAWYGMVWYGNCLFDTIKSTLKHNSKYRISES